MNKKVSVTTKADASTEATEKFRVILSAATGGAIIADAVGNGTLVNDD